MKALIKALDHLSTLCLLCLDLARQSLKFCSDQVLQFHELYSLLDHPDGTISHLENGH